MKNLTVADNRAQRGVPRTIWYAMSKTTEKETKKNRNRSLYQKLEDVVGCRWSVSVLMAKQDGVARPGALERHIAGISTKVLSERLS